MKRKQLKPLLLALVVSLLLTMVATVQAGNGGNPPANGRPDVTVATYNVYLGADLTPVVAAPDFPAFLVATSGVYLSAQATDFPARATAIAGQIAASEPLLVGLQESTLWRTGAPFDPAPAETVVTDFLQLLLDALDAAGASYTPVVVQQGSDLEVPTLLGFDVRLTTSDVLLARSDLSNLKLKNPQSGNYATTLTLPIIAGPVTIPRSWVAIDGKYRGQNFRVVSTHLESFHPLVRLGQVSELLAGPVVTDRAVILVGDFNSEAGVPGDAAQLVLDAGFSDTWSAVNPGDPGYSCCQAADLLNPVSLLSERIDFVFYRGDATPLAAELLGEDLADRTPDGLWPSDHAGVVGTVRVQPGN